MRNPLIKRIPREYKSELGKQIAVFLFFVLIIGAVSGIIISADSMIKSYNDSFEKLNRKIEEVLDSCEAATGSFKEALEFISRMQSEANDLTKEDIKLLQQISTR